MKFYKYQITDHKDKYYGMFSIKDDVDVKKVEKQLGVKCIEIKDCEIA